MKKIQFNFSFTPKYLAFTAVIAALYVALTFAVYYVAYGAVQLRLSEALTVLPFMFPQTIPGLFIGCAVANIFSPISFPYDMIFGSLATLLAAYLTARMPNKYLAPLPPVIINGVVVGALLTVFFNEGNQAFMPLFGLNSLYVAIGEAIICYGVGLLLLKSLEKFKMKDILRI